MLRGICLIALGLLSVGSVYSAEGRIPIYEPVLIDGSSGEPISGLYFLTEDITGNSAGPVIEFRGDGTQRIELDLNGFTVTAGSSAAEAIRVKDLQTFSVRNGTAVKVGTSTPVLFMEASSDELGSEEITVEKVTIIGGKHGISMFRAKNFTVQGNSIFSPGSHGLNVGGNPLAESQSQGVVRENRIRGAGEHGILLRTNISSVIIERNQLERNRSNGIHVAPGEGGAVIVADNAAEMSGFRGIFVNKTRSCRISGNVVHASGQNTPELGFGIQVGGSASGCLVVNNSATFSENDGLSILGQYNVIKHNLLNQNKGFGLMFEVGPDEGDPSPSFNTYGDNTARGNGSSSPSCTQTTATCPGHTLPDFCDQDPGDGQTSTNTSSGGNLMPGSPPC